MPWYLWQYKGSTFKVATFSRWLVVISGPHAFDEFRKATDDELSLMKALEEVCVVDILCTQPSNEIADSRYWLHNGAKSPYWWVDTESRLHVDFVDITLLDAYHVPVIRKHLTKNLGILFPDIRDEIVHAFNDEIALTAGELWIPGRSFISLKCVQWDWTKVSASKTVMQIISRTSHRIFVGFPLCMPTTDAEPLSSTHCLFHRSRPRLAHSEHCICDWRYQSVPNHQAISCLFETVSILWMIMACLGIYVWTELPVAYWRMSQKQFGAVWSTWPVLSRIADGTLMNTENSGMENQCTLFSPYNTVECSCNYFQNDMLSWLMDEASEVEMSTRNLTLRIMLISFVAIHTSSMVTFFLVVWNFMLMSCDYSYLHTLFTTSLLCHITFNPCAMK